ncbi:MAG: hypothetical protein AABY22_09570 [Nanoarchaeota archaeon]
MKSPCKICHNPFLADDSGLEKFDEASQEWLEVPANVCGKCVNIKL